jgi:UDP-2,4-diacetamido-2,4,6-trideoxy-beta-L-altropyranose hydrolase
MRCLSLALGWESLGGKGLFVLAKEDAGLEVGLAKAGFEVIRLATSPGGADDARATAELALSRKASWVVVDGYHFDADYQKILKDAGPRMLFIDDYGHADFYSSDLILNQNSYAEEFLYQQRAPYTRLLLGTRYALLREEFQSWSCWRRQIPMTAQKVLVTLGGSDPNNVTLKVIEALKKVSLEGLEAVVVAGRSNPYYEELCTSINGVSFPIRIEKNVTNMPELMGWADVAISGGGTTCFELAFMGLPSLVIILADNQRLNAKDLAARGVALNLGWHESVSINEITQTLTQLLRSPEIRAAMSLRGKELVDGQGVARVLNYLAEDDLQLSPANRADCQLLWEWANDPEVRKVSFSSMPIPMERHVQWFESKISDPNYVILIVKDREANPVGQVRFAVNHPEAVISVSIDQKYRGRGYGSKAIRTGCQKLFSDFTVNVIHAYIKSENATSIRSFLKAGFAEAGIAVVEGVSAIHLTLRRDESA